MAISYILSQVALEPELGLIFQELTQSFGTTILFRSHKLEPEKADYSFSELAAQAAARGETAIGVVTSSAGSRQTRLNPGAHARWACEEIEQVIVLGLRTGLAEHESLNSAQPGNEDHKGQSRLNCNSYIDRVWRGRFARYRYAQSSLARIRNAMGVP